MKSLFKTALILLFSSIVLFSCKDDDDNDNGLCGNNWSPAVELESEITALSDAITVYSNDPTVQNCEAYKAAFQDYLNAIVSWEECYVHIGQQEQWQQDIDEAQADLDELECQ